MYRCTYADRICAHGARYEEAHAAPTEPMSTSCVDASGGVRCAHVTINFENGVTIHCFYTTFFPPKSAIWYVLNFFL